MSNASDFLIENERLEKYVGTSGDIVIPEGVRYLSYFAFSGTVVTSMVLPKTLYDKPRLCDQKYFAHLTVPAWLVSAALQCYQFFSVLATLHYSNDLIII